MELQNRLMAKGKRPNKPVNVKLLIDDQSGFVGAYMKWAGEILRLDHLDPTGRDVYGLGFQRHINPDYVHLEVKLYRHTMTGTNHSKSIVVDRSYGIVTGANFMTYHDKTDEFQGIAEFTDHGFLVMGEVSKGLARDFYSAWKDGTDYRGNTLIRGTNRHTNFGKGITKLPKVIEDLMDEKALAKDIPIAIISRNPNNNPFKRNHYNPQNQAFISIFRNAKAHIEIANPVLGTKKIVEEIVAAIKRGVDINILLSKNYQDRITSMPGAGGTNSSNVRKVFKKIEKAKKKARKRGEKIKFGKFNIKWFVDRKGRLSKDLTHTSHTKYISADNQIVLVGSTNLDNQSFFFSREVNVLVDSADITKKWCQKTFRTDFLRAQNYQEGD